MTVIVRYTHTHPYFQLAPGEPFRPYIPVRLQHDGRYLDTLGLVDSGADSSMFNAQFAQALGIDLNKGRTSSTRGIGGFIPVWYFNIHLSVYGMRFAANVAFSHAWTPGTLPCSTYA